jgi:hypothetical protein
MSGRNGRLRFHRSHLGPRSEGWPTLHLGELGAMTQGCGVGSRENDEVVAVEDARGNFFSGPNASFRGHFKNLRKEYNVEAVQRLLLL